MLLAYAWRGGSRARTKVIAASLLFASTDFLSGVILKTLIHRDRPTGGNDSFPSSHATNAFGQAVFWSCLHPRLSPLFLLLAILIGLSRIALGKHWPSDVLAGAILGGLLGFAAWRASLAFGSRKTESPTAGLNGSS